MPKNIYVLVIKIFLRFRCCCRRQCCLKMSESMIVFRVVLVRWFMIMKTLIQNHLRCQINDEACESGRIQIIRMDAEDTALEKHEVLFVSSGDFYNVFELCTVTVKHDNFFVFNMKIY